MAKGAARIGDQSTGHDCHPPQIAVKGSHNVKINGRGAMRVGDKFMVHCCEFECHPGFLEKGSSTVSINGIPAGRIQDAVGCGGSVATGSTDVLIG
ncbi:PAAR domain-containing protein [Flavobacterium sp.]|uniref:PAAR domain-containing protein n=1 Tax=Flavobacterium sp. TaxID=239 RepID=UPI0026375763|nr:PAAR domain-containing protein [Flavobacterium sp.]